MMLSIVYGIGNYCAGCDETHDHPLHNIVEIIDDDEVVETDRPAS